MFGFFAKRRAQQLHQAAGDGNSKSLAVLISKGVDVNSRNAYGGTPLMIAVKRGHSESVKVLLDHGADPNAVMSPPQDPQQTYTALHSAAQNANDDLVALLVERGANFDATTGHGESPLMSAAFYGHDSTIRLLLRLGADKLLKTSEGKNAAEYAKQNGHLSAYKLLN